MLDVTGSMKGQKFTDMKAAATDLVNIVIPDSTSGNTVKIAIVPFAEGVRLPSSANAAARGNPADPLNVTYTDWNGGNDTVHSYYTSADMRCRAHRHQQVHRRGARHGQLRADGLRLYRRQHRCVRAHG